MPLFLRRLVPLAFVLIVAVASRAAAQSPPPSGGRQFTLLVYERPADLAARTDPARAAAYWDAFNAYAGAMQQAGVLRGGTALEGVAGETGARRLSGYFVIEVPAEADARAWAARAPGGSRSVLVRAHLANPTMTH